MPTPTEIMALTAGNPSEEAQELYHRMLMARQGGLTYLGTVNWAKGYPSDEAEYIRGLLHMAQISAQLDSEPASKFGLLRESWRQLTWRWRLRWRLKKWRFDA